MLSICRIDERGRGTRIELDQPGWLYSEEPVLTGRNEHDLALAAGVHMLLPSDSPVVIVSFHLR